MRYPVLYSALHISCHVLLVVTLMDSYSIPPCLIYGIHQNSPHFPSCNRALGARGLSVLAPKVWVNGCLCLVVPVGPEGKFWDIHEIEYLKSLYREYP